MKLPKAFLCFLGDEFKENPQEEIMLRDCGFATATLAWKDLLGQQNAWTELLQVIDHPDVSAWLIVGKEKDFTEQIMSQIAMITLGMKRINLPSMGFLLKDKKDKKEIQDFSLPYILNNAHIFHEGQKFAPKMMAQKSLKISLPKLDFRCTSHISPLLGQWIEIGPKDIEWQGFMCGVIGAKVLAFGVGEKGFVPKKSALKFPQCGIEGEWGEFKFSACAAHNIVDKYSSCYFKVEGTPQKIFKVEHQEIEYENQAESQERCWLELIG